MLYAPVDAAINYKRTWKGLKAAGHYLATTTDVQVAKDAGRAIGTGVAGWYKDRVDTFHNQGLNEGLYSIGHDGGAVSAEVVGWLTGGGEAKAALKGTEIAGSTRVLTGRAPGIALAVEGEFELRVLGGARTFTTPSGHLIDIPESLSLSNVEARDWYVKHDAAIPEYLSGGAGLEARAKDAWGLRNAFRTASRRSMIDQDLATHLNATRPNLTWQQTVEKYGSDWQKIIDASQRSNEAVNKALGVKRPGVH